MNYKNYTIEPDNTGCNIDETLKAHRIDYKWDGSDYYIGMLDQLKGDFYIR